MQTPENKKSRSSIYTETAFRFVSENTSHGETATEKVGVHPILVCQGQAKKMDFLKTTAEQ